MKESPGAAKLPKLRSAMSLARLLVARGGAADACAALQPACEAMAEGRDMTDLKVAAGLLAEWGNR